MVSARSRRPSSIAKYSLRFLQYFPYGTVEARGRGEKSARRSSSTRFGLTVPSTNSYPSRAKIRPRANIGRAFPYQSTQEALQSSSGGFTDADSKRPSSLKRSKSFFRKITEADPSRNCSRPGRLPPVIGRPSTPPFGPFGL